MNDTTVGNLSGLAGRVAAYVREVRAELADLPMEDLDDLTGGMDADLTELAAECGGDLDGRLGTPRLYAAELRAAAGLPERMAGSGGRRRPLAEAGNHARASFTTLTEQHAWLLPVTAFLVSIRPAWWVLRGYLAAWAVGGVLGINHGIRPRGFAGTLLALVAIVVSVQLGRGWLRHMAMTRPVLVLGNATAVVVALIASSAGVTSGELNYSTETSPAPGVSLNGDYVGNIYPYGANGNRITGVRLFAQDGRPLGGGDAYDPQGNPTGVVRDGSGAPVTNAYPKPLFGPDPWQVIDPSNPGLDQGAWTPPMSIVPLAPSPTATPTEPAPAATTPPAPSATSRPVVPKSTLPTQSSGRSPSVTPSGR